MRKIYIKYHKVGILYQIFLLKICLISKKYVSLHPIFVSCLIFKRENYGKKIDHAHGGGLFFQQE